jgi:hypothetical protein
LSSSELIDLNFDNLKIDGEFEAVKCGFTAKGCQMEQKVLEQWGCGKVCEVQDLFFKLRGVEMNLDGIHG